MRAHTITTKCRPRRMARRLVLALALGVSAVAIPVSASASPVDGTVDGRAAEYIASGSSDSSRPGGGSDYSFVSSIAPPASEQSSPSGSGDSSLNGEPRSSPTRPQPPAMDSTGRVPRWAQGPYWLSSRSAEPRCSRRGVDERNASGEAPIGELTAHRGRLHRLHA